MNLECLSPQDKFSAGSAGAVPGHKSIPWAQGIPAEGQSHPHKGGTAGIMGRAGRGLCALPGIRAKFWDHGAKFSQPDSAAAPQLQQGGFGARGGFPWRNSRFTGREASAGTAPPLPSQRVGAGILGIPELTSPHSQTTHGEAALQNPTRLESSKTPKKAPLKSSKTPKRTFLESPSPSKEHSWKSPKPQEDSSGRPH